MKMGRPRELVLMVDVNFWDDPKIRKLSPVERDKWLQVLAEQLRTGNGRKLPLGHWGLSRQRVAKYLDAGLLDEVEGDLYVHGWDNWNGRDAYKKFLARARQRRRRGQQED